MSRRRRKNNSDGNFDVLTIIICIIFGLGWSVMGNRMYGMLCDVLWRPLVIGLYFAGLALMQFLAIQLSGLIRGNYGKGDHVLKSLGLVLAVFLAGTVLDFVYELRVPERMGKPTSYIFLIDDSGSNEWNDPHNKRGEAIVEVMNTCDPDFPYAVYSFRSSANLLVPMTNAGSAKSVADRLATSGGTDIMLALSTVLNDIEDGVHSDAGEAPRIILLSDGEDNDSGLSRVHRMCKKLNVSICTIGFGDAEGDLLHNIAAGARGVSLTIDDVEYLENAMNTAATAVSNEKYDLLSFRDNVKFDFLYVILRLVFVLILGVLFLLMKIELTRTNVGSSNTLPVHLILLLISGASLEVGINILRFPVIWVHMIMCVLFLLTFSAHGNQSNSNQFNGGGDFGNVNYNNMLSTSHDADVFSGF